MPLRKDLAEKLADQVRRDFDAVLPKFIQETAKRLDTDIDTVSQIVGMELLQFSGVMIGTSISPDLSLAAMMKPIEVAMFSYSELAEQHG